MNQLAELLAAPRPDASALKALLDGTTHEERVRMTRSLPRKLMKTLYEVTAAHPAPPDVFIPKDVAPLTVVNHVGTNSLPLNRKFGKPMYRAPSGVIGGRNVQAFEWLVGPGYFTVEDNKGGESVIDYINVPSEAPSDWPKIKSNAGGLSFFVFRNLRDSMRVVSEHVTVGKATRNGKDLGQFFVLVREA